MLKKLTILSVLLCCMVPMVMAQTLKLEPRGISPAQVIADTVGNPNYVGIFNRTFSGLLTVGVQTQMYLKGTITGGSFASPTWSVTQKPAGSAAVVGNPVIKDVSTEYATLTPDLEGTYIVELADGGKTASVTINSAKFRGIDEGACAVCHSGQIALFSKTGHASFLKNALNGVSPFRSGPTCIACHTTGYDVNAANNGFDDFNFTYPATVGAGVYDATVAAYPDAMKRANIQCEACHGPGSSHFGKTENSKMVSSLSEQPCAACHDDSHYHVYPSQWEYSNHANMQHPYTRASCAPCHNGKGFLQFLASGKKGLTNDVDANYPITCAVCHDPHDAANEYQLRTLDVTLGNGEVVTGGGLGKLCMNCHKSRRDAEATTGPNFSYSGSYGPHHGPQADMLIGTNALTFGKTLPSSAHFAAIKDACVDCHMYEKGSHGEHDDQGNLNSSGMHSFSMVNKNGVDNVAACEGCHGDIGESFAEKKFFLNGKADHDEDGKEEGLQEEVHGLLQKLARMLQPVNSDTVDMSGKYIVTQTEAKAAYNYFFVEEDRSLGVHNPAFAISLLKVSIQAVKNHALNGDIVAIEDVPNDQGKQVRIIWNKMADDGVAIDPIAKYIVKRDDGDEAWTGVGEHTADSSPRYALVVPTVFDSTGENNGMTAFKIMAVSRGGMVHESMPGEGYSVDNLVPHAPGSFMAMLAAGKVELSWEAPADPDINYYRVYRGADASFTPDESNMIGTTTDLTLTDTPSGAGNYFYVVAAIDFSGNLGEFTNPVNANLTSVAKDGAVPADYELSQNYPNPFNPETSISFSLKQNGKVTLNIYNSNGQIVKTLVDHDMSAGNHSISFVADGLTSGLYIYRIMVTNGEGVQFQAVRKMVLMK
ncbi:MAG TPA: T9SS type A sorting domain-containing protein [bacterium]